MSNIVPAGDNGALSHCPECAAIEQRLAEANAKLEAVGKLVDDAIGAGRGRTFAASDPNGIFADAMIEIAAVLNGEGQGDG